MPTLPDVNSISQGSPQPSGGIAAYDPPNWRQVGMAGQEISGAGRDLEQAADTIAQTNARQDEIVAQSAANSLRQATVSLQYDPNNGFANVKEGGAVGQQFVDNYRQQFQQAQQGIRSALTTPNQQRMFDQNAQVVGLQFKQALLEHQARQTDAFNDTTANDTVNLALRGMATRPLDDLNFAAGLAQINATLDGVGQRKGLPAVAVQQMKSQMLDAAYNTRISSVLNGIPGVVQANPYLAEKMFNQVQDQLGPASQVTLAQQVQKGVQQVQQRDLAKTIIAGGMPPSADLLAPITTGTAPLAAIVQGMESGGNSDAVSPKGAQGAMQVMPGTAANPGFGVRPAQLGPDGKPLPGELERVGRDYLGAMTARYSDPALVLAAYNAGPGQVDKWIAQNGDPRLGQVSSSDWAAKIPFDETQKYVANGLQQLSAAHAVVAAADTSKSNPAQFAGTTGADGALPPVAATAQPQAPTANELKTRLPAMMAAARDSWLQMYPNDIVGADGAATRVASYGQLTIAQQQGQQESARDTLTRGLVGAAPDGSQRATTMDQLLADPQMKAAWNAATPEIQLAIQDRMKQGGDPPRTAATQALVYQLQGQFTNDRQGFANMDLTPLIPQLPFADFDKLASLQMAARNKADIDAERSANMVHALTLANDYAMKPAGIRVPDKNTSPDSAIARNYNAFTGALGQALDAFQAKNNRRPNDQEIIGIAKGLTTTVQTPGNVWGTNATLAYQITPDTMGAETANVPPDFRAGITAAIKARGVDPTEAQVQTAYLLHLRPDLAGARSMAQLPGPAPAAPVAPPRPDFSPAWSMPVQASAHNPAWNYNGQSFGSEQEATAARNAAITADAGKSVRPAVGQNAKAQRALSDEWLALSEDPTHVSGRTPAYQWNGQTFADQASARAAQAASIAAFKQRNGG